MEIKDSCCYCGTCASVCPMNAIELLDSGEVEIDRIRCAEYLCRRWSCGICAKACPVGAIVIAGRKTRALPQGKWRNTVR